MNKMTVTPLAKLFSTSLQTLFAWLIVCIIVCRGTQLQSDDCNTMPINPENSQPYDLNNFDDHTYVMFVAESVGDELDITYGCEFGFNFVLAQVRETTPYTLYIPNTTLHCKDGLWDINGDPLTEFPPCIPGQSYFSRKKFHVWENSRLFTLPGVLDHRNTSIVYGDTFHFPFVQAGMNFATLRTSYKESGIGYYIPDPDIEYDDISQFFPNSDKWKVVIHFPNGSAVPGNFTMWQETDEFATYISNFTSEPLYLHAEDSGYFYYSDTTIGHHQYTKINWGTMMFKEAARGFRFESFYIQFLDPVDGEWGDWAGYGPCDTTCLPGNALRYRFCDNPSPAHGGAECEGEQNKTMPCVGIDPCPVDGNWTPWGAWGECVTECAEGIREKTRTCTDPAPDWGGLDCEGEKKVEEACFSHACPIDGGWADWEEWSTCSTMCGVGTRNRIQPCTNPEPQYGGADCQGDPVALESCVGTNCNADGNWAQWAVWSSCSLSCGFGVKTRTRSCTDPAPLGTGADCPGSGMLLNYYQEEPCMELLECPIDGNWTIWTVWSDCTVFCGGGSNSRSRTCTNPTPSHGGQDCQGNNTETMEGCNSQACGINGGWGQWSEWLAPCTVTCGGGIQIRNRTCDNPTPTYGGQDCRGSSLHKKACSTKPCMDGAWTSWSMWSVCSHSCRGGVQARGRSCTNPRPGPVGKDCPAKDPYTMWQRCNTQPCPIDGRWDNWSEWSECPVSCGGGNSVRLRNCSNPLPQWGGKNCKGPSVRERTCNTHVCPLIAVPHNVQYSSFHDNITVTWEVPVEYEWPVLYYIVHFRERMSRNQTLTTLLHAKGEAGYHYNMYDLKSFVTRPTKDNSSYSMTIRRLKPFTEYEFCMTSKYNHIKNSEHTQVKVVKTKKFPWPAPPNPVTIEYADVAKEREYKVLIRWKENDWANYSAPAQYHLMIRDVLERRLPPKGWTILTSVTTEITGYLLRESKSINLKKRMYIIQVTASNRHGTSEAAVCKDIIDYQSVGVDGRVKSQVEPLQSVIQGQAFLYRSIPVSMLFLIIIVCIYAAMNELRERRQNHARLM